MIIGQSTAINMEPLVNTEQQAIKGTKITSV